MAWSQSSGNEKWFCLSVFIVYINRGDLKLLPFNVYYLYRYRPCPWYLVHINSLSISKSCHKNLTCPPVLTKKHIFYIKNILLRKSMFKKLNSLLSVSCHVTHQTLCLYQTVHFKTSIFLKYNYLCSINNIKCEFWQYRWWKNIGYQTTKFW